MGIVDVGKQQLGEQKRATRLLEEAVKILGGGLYTPF